MKVKKRFAVLGVTFVASLVILRLFHLLQADSVGSYYAVTTPENPSSPSFISLDALSDGPEGFGLPRWQPSLHHSPQCTMASCFDFSRCKGDFKVHIYSISSQEPDPLGLKPKVSARYEKILAVIRDSNFFTPDPTKACLFVLADDTLDRDVLSVDYVKNFQKKLNELPSHVWNGGQNHLIFNLYSGTWPNYMETDWGFSPGKAMLAKASFSVGHFRPEFDISLPLYHIVLPLRGGDIVPESKLHFPSTDSYLLVFKGKRYVHGIGSDTRNSLYHLHNNRDIIMLTTCKHGKTWKEKQDDRCQLDNDEYDRWDYNKLMGNTTFCLVPRGRRLGSFRFLEALQTGCIPIILSNEWELPFSEVIDWNAAVIWADERLLLQVPDIIRSISQEKIFAMRQRAQQLYRFYFSSVENIVFTTLEIIRDRVQRWKSRNGLAWNSGSASGLFMPQLTDVLSSYPFFISTVTQPQFTAFVYADSCSLAVYTPLYKLLIVISKSPYAKKILLLWGCKDKPVPKITKWPSNRVLIETVDVRQRGFGAQYEYYSHVDTPAVFGFTENISISLDEINFAVEVWQYLPDRLIGYFARSHYWAGDEWVYTSKSLNHYSMILCSGCIYHSYFNYLYSYHLSGALRSVVAQTDDCHDILFNMLITRVTGKSPLKLSHKTASLINSNKRPGGFAQKQSCLNTFVALMGYMPLKRSKVRLDPLLHRDNVSVWRKKFRQMET